MLDFYSEFLQRDFYGVTLHVTSVFNMFHSEGHLIILMRYLPQIPMNSLKRFYGLFSTNKTIIASQSDPDEIILSTAITYLICRL